MLLPSTILGLPPRIIMRNAISILNCLTKTIFSHARSEIIMHVSSDILLSDFAQADVRNSHAYKP